MTLEGLSTFIRGLPQELMREATPDIAAAVHEALNVTIRAHQSPYGVPWAPRKRGTRPVLNNAADAVTHTSVGNRIYIAVRGINARHHKGAVRGSVQRPIIIYKKHGAKAITPRIALAIQEAVTKRFHESIAKAKAA
jgi:hypothetical protein